MRKKIQIVLNLHFQCDRYFTFEDFIFGPKEKISYSEQMVALTCQVILFREGM